MLLRLTLLVAMLVHLPQNLLAVEDVIFKSGFEQTNILAAPTGLGAAAISMTRIDLKWTDNTDTESGFTVEHSLNGINWSVETTLVEDTTVYTDNNLSPATKHYYRVRAFDAETHSSWSNIASATTEEEPPPDPPAAPTNLSATAVDSYSIHLTWLDNASTETGFVIEHSTNGVNWSGEVSLGANVKTYTDTGLSPSTVHYYRVRAFDAGTDLSSDWSNVAEATTDEEPPPNPPTAPSGLRASAASTSSIGLSWNDNSSTETGFTIEHSLDKSNWSAETNVGANVTTYVDTGLSPLSKHYYRVRAFDANTSSSWSNTNWATTPSVAAPSGLVATAIDSQNIELTWVDNSNNETGFRIKRRVELTGYVTAGVVAANTTSFTSSNLKANTLYIFQVYAYNADGDSIWSNIASATTPP